MKQYPQYIILILISFCIFRCGTTHQRQEAAIKSNGTEYFSNGYIKQEIIEKTDTSMFVQFYSPLDSGRIDSAYYYEMFRDTMVAFDQYIINMEAIAENVHANVQEDSLEFRLKNQKHLWISLYLLNEEEKSDSMIWYNTGGNTSKIKIVKPVKPWRVKSVHDWGVWVKGNDSIGRTIRRIYQPEL